MLPPPRLHQPLRRVVVTGLGCASPLGGTAAESWRRAQRGESAAAQFDIDGASFVAARCGDLALDEKREKARVVALALRAAAEAVRDAGGLEAHAPARRGASIASGVGGLGDIVDAAHRVAEGKKLSPFFVPRALCNTAAGAVSLEHSCAGPVQTSAAACAAGAQSVGDAFRLVQRGDCDVALCGGAEACVDEVALRGFARMGALSRDGAARPFDAARSGFVLGEGAAVLVLEDAASAARRGARAYAELRGYGLGGDAVHGVGAAAGRRGRPARRARRAGRRRPGSGARRPRERARGRHARRRRGRARGARGFARRAARRRRARGVDEGRDGPPARRGGRARGLLRGPGAQGSNGAGDGAPRGAAAHVGARDARRGGDPPGPARGALDVERLRRDERGPRLFARRCIWRPRRRGTGECALGASARGVFFALCELGCLATRPLPRPRPSCASVWCVGTSRYTALDVTPSPPARRPSRPECSFEFDGVAAPLRHRLASRRRRDSRDAAAASGGRNTAPLGRARLADV